MTGLKMLSAVKYVKSVKKNSLRQRGKRRVGEKGAAVFRLA
jgi:hypothetical protein